MKKENKNAVISPISSMTMKIPSPQGFERKIFLKLINNLKCSNRNLKDLMIQEGNTLTIQISPKIFREFSFQKIFGSEEDFESIFKYLIIPMLKCTIKEKQDSSLMIFGIAHYIIKLLGAYPNFYKSNNILTSTLAFIFENVIKYDISSILISLFQVNNYNINDLFSSEFNKISSRYADNYNEAIQLLIHGFQKMDSNSKSIENLFITIELNFHSNINDPTGNGCILSFIVIFDESALKQEESIYDTLKKYIWIIERNCEKNVQEYEKKHLLCSLLRQNIENDSLINFLQCIDPLLNYNSTFFSQVLKILELCNILKNVSSKAIHQRQESINLKNGKSSIDNNSLNESGITEEENDNKITTNSRAIKDSVKILVNKALSLEKIPDSTISIIIRKISEQLISYSDECNILINDKKLENLMSDFSLYDEISKSIKKYLEIRSNIFFSKVKSQIETLSQQIAFILFSSMCKNNNNNIINNGTQIQRYLKGRSYKKSNAPNDKFMMQNFSRKKEIKDNINLSVKEQSIKRGLYKEKGSSRVLKSTLDKSAQNIESGRKSINISKDSRSISSISRLKSNKVLCLANKLNNTNEEEKNLNKCIHKIDNIVGNNLKSVLEKRLIFRNQKVHKKNWPTINNVNIKIDEFEENENSISKMTGKISSKHLRKTDFAFQLNTVNGPANSQLSFFRKPNKTPTRFNIMKQKEFNQNKINNKTTFECEKIFEYSNNKEETKNTNLTKKNNQPQINIASFLDDKDRPILEEGDLKARIKNFAIMGANMNLTQRNKNPEESVNSRSNTPKKSEINCIDLDDEFNSDLGEEVAKIGIPISQILDSFHSKSKKENTNKKK